MLNLSHYQETDQLYAGSRTLVYRATSSTTEEPVIIKVLRNPHPNFDELVQFRNQYVITCNLEHPTIVRPLALERYGNGYALVMPDGGAVSLWEYWQQSEQSLAEFLSIAIQLAESLHYLTQQRIIHKDIKPANILIHPETGKVQIIDFSISSLLPKEQQQLINPNVLEGTLAYISPEQTGRMNRGIDYRTDFYSLGVTFFELLNGKLPFETNDPMELVHCHIAQEVKFPTSIKQETVPEMVQAIVLKLMAKNAEDRYQSSLGLKYDLERCLQQLENTREITSFVLGERDASDRFLIQEKLYGREAEVQSLLDAFNRVANPPESPLNKGGHRGVEMMLVAGFSGIGKTAVVNEVHKPIVKKRGYFIKGKYDQFNRNLPFSAFLQAFRDLMRQLLGESDADLANWKAKITAALGPNGSVIIDVIPELEQIIGKQPPVPELSGSAAQNRFNLVFGQFIASLTSPEHPLVMFLDDLQWADLASLNLMEVLMSDSSIDYLLFLGAYRDNEVFPAHPLMLSLAELRKTQAVISTITLEPLAQNHINQLVADALNCSQQLAQPLTELVYQKTKGNPFFTTQFLKGLQVDGLIKFNLELGYWECDLVQVRDAALTDDVVEFMAGRLRKLPSATQNVLKLAACIGNQFQLETLAVICEESSEGVAADIWRALQEGLILPVSEAYKFFQGDVEEATDQTVTVGYRFLHDRVQQAAYFLIPEDQKQKTHLTIGQLLLENTSQADWEEQLFDIANHLNLGVSLIVSPQEKKQLCELNLEAGIKAQHATAFAASIEYLLLGIELLPENSWEQEYEVTLSLYQSATESAYLNGNLQQMEQLANVGLENSRNLLDTIKIYEVQIQALQAQSRFHEAIDTAMVILGKLGIRQFPEEPDSSDVELWLHEVRENLGDRHPSSLIELPAMTDPKALAAINILINVLPSTYKSKPNLAALVCFEQVNLSLQYGNSPVAAYSYSLHGLALCGVCNDIEVGAQFGELALQLLEMGNTASAARALQIIYGHTKHGKEHLRNTLKGFKQGYSVALETGDLEFAGYTLSFYSVYSYLCGKELSELSRELSANSKALERIKRKITKNWIDIVLQAINNLLGQSEDPCVMVGEAYDEREMVPFHQEANDVTTLSYFYIARSVLCYLLQNDSQASQDMVNAEKSLGGAAGTPWESVFYFYSSLVTLTEIASRPPNECQDLLEKIAANQQILSNAAVHAPENNLHKWHLVEAEKHRVLGEKMAAMELYDQAISGAKEQKYIQEEALANELAAKFYLDWGKDKVAAGYMQEAYYCYAQWGAKVKTEQLEEQYPQLLRPILQQPEPLLTPSNLQSDTKTLGKVTGVTSALDLTSAIKASQALSEEIALDTLLSKLMGIVLENAGADAGSLILDNSGTWEIVAQCISSSCSLSTISLEQTDNLPSSIINTVKRTQQVLLINDVEQDTTFARDSYLIQKSPQSLCCTPILNQGKLIGILYLENNLTAEAFTSDRIEVLKLLTAQAAISIENARLYQTLEDKVKERTAQLARANQEISALNEKLQEENLRLSAELEVTKQLQQMVLPKQSELESIEGLEIAGFMEPADEVGGDYYDVMHQDGKVKISIGDVTGHGLESGVVMLMAQTAVRTLQESKETDPIQFLDILNRTIYRNVQRINPYKNLTLSLLEYNEGKLTVSGQHEEIILVRAEGQVECLDTSELGFPLGLEEEIRDFIDQEQVQLNPGDVVVLYTDGITEAFNINQEQYGLEKLCEVIRANSSLSAEAIKQAVIDDVRRHIGSQKVFDDITLVVLKQK
ncbi:MAG: AAA family ATPase [Symploca sp. SIO1B1]|nr:AAA family ATPase [Symploca sp. SIO1B1]